VRRVVDRLVPALPTTGRRLDGEHARQVAELTRPRAAGSPPPLSSLDPAEVRRADTAVVLGSGPSARIVEDPAIGRDPALDFFALNHAAALPVDVRLSSIEEPVLKGRQADMDREDAIGLLLWSLERGGRLAGGAPLVVRGSWDEPETRELATTTSERGAHVLVSPRFALSVHGADGARRYAEWARRRRPFRWPVGEEPVHSPRGGLGFLVSLCIGLGYPTIVLAGVDMTSDEYFFDTWGDDPDLARLRARLRPPSDSPHLTSVASGGRPPIGDLLIALDEGYLRPEGRRLLVGSPASLLHPALDVHEWATG
jgi:hypothetical protein